MPPVFESADVGYLILHACMNVLDHSVHFSLTLLPTGLECLLVDFEPHLTYLMVGRGRCLWTIISFENYNIYGQWGSCGL